MKRTRNRKKHRATTKAKEKEMSEKIPNCKRGFEEASSSSISSHKKTKLNDSSSNFHDNVIAASSSSSVDSASDEWFNTSAGEENDQSSSINSGCFSSLSKEISTNSSKPIVDLEVHQTSKTERKTSTIITSDFRKETNPMNEEGCEEGETTIEMMERKDDRRKPAEVRKTPTSTEIEEFFWEVENDHKQKEFIEKYNFDILNDKPLQGRYMWNPLF